MYVLKLTNSDNRTRKHYYTPITKLMMLIRQRETNINQPTSLSLMDVSSPVPTSVPSSSRKGCWSCRWTSTRIPADWARTPMYWDWSMKSIALNPGNAWIIYSTVNSSMVWHSLVQNWSWLAVECFWWRYLTLYQNWPINSPTTPYSNLETARYSCSGF